MRKNIRHAALVRQQLEGRTSSLKGLGNTPAKGWIRSIREALGMSGRQFAAHLGVEPPRIAVLEKSEATGGVTLRSLRKAAEVLDCELVYAFVPKTSLEDTLRRQAYKAAVADMRRVSHTMRLEDQGLSVKDEGEMLHERAEDLMREMPRRLWEIRDNQDGKPV